MNQFMAGLNLLILNPFYMRAPNGERASGDNESARSALLRPLGLSEGRAPS